MSEKENTQDEGTTKTKDDSGTGDETKTLTALEIADGINKKKEELLDRDEALTARKENLQARQDVGGETQAGQASKEKVEESDHDYRVRVQKEMAAGKTEFGN